MQREFLVLLAVCAITTALPRNKRELESASEVPEELTTTTTAEPESKVITVKTASGLEAQLTQAGNKVVLLFLMTSWCSHSRKAIPVVEEIAANNQNVVAIKIDVDKTENDGTGKAWKFGAGGVSKVPTFMIVRKGVKLEEIIGYAPKKLRNAVSRYAPSHEDQ